ncbi:MAG: chloride channel protein, partial [Candidatus Heimdallarchaeota archaeon]
MKGEQEKKPPKTKSSKREKDLEKESDYNSAQEDNVSSYLKSEWKDTRKGMKHRWKRTISDIKHPKKAIRNLVKSKRFITNSLAVVVGLVGALAVLAFEWLNEGSKLVFMDKLFPSMYGSFGSWKFLAIIITPLIAAILTAPIIWKFNPESKGSGIPYVMESIVLRDGHCRRRTPFIKMFTSAVCSSGGLSVGREGPITQIGAGLSAGIARMVGLHGRNMRIVVISGLSAAIAATFNSPIGGALFGIEILLVSLVADEIVPVVIASLTASTFSALFDIARISPNSSGYPEPSFNIGVLRDLDWSSFIHHIHWFLLFGLLAGLLGVFYSKFFHLTREVFNRIRLSKLFIPILGALLTGVVAIASPRNSAGIPLVFGGSYASITDILNNDTTTMSSQNPFNSILSFLIVLMLL